MSCCKSPELTRLLCVASILAEEAKQLPIEMERGDFYRRRGEKQTTFFVVFFSAKTIGRSSPPFPTEKFGLTETEDESLPLRADSFCRNLCAEKFFKATNRTLREKFLRKQVDASVPY